MLQEDWSILRLRPSSVCRGYHGQAIGLHGTVTAAFTHVVVDERPLCRVRKLLALAATAFLGGAGLVVDQYGTAGNFPQFPLYLVQFTTVVEGDVLRETVLVVVVFFGLIAEHNNAFRALCSDLLGNGIDGDLAIHRLAAGHGHGVVEQDLVGNVNAGGHRLANGHRAGVEVGAFPQVLEYMGVAGVTTLADPVDAFAAHLDQGLGVATHPGRHKVAADTGQGLAAFRYLGRGVVGQPEQK